VDRTKKTFFYHFCGNLVVVEKDAPDPKWCTTPGCKRPDGFGSKARRR
jgi:hypothetical protein